MIYANDPPPSVKALMGIAAVMVILLTGVTLGVLSEADSLAPISPSAASEPRSVQEEDGVARPVLRLEDANRRALNQDALAPCRQRMQQDAAEAGAETCSPQPMQIDKQKLLVLLALWRIMS